MRILLFTALLGLAALGADWRIAIRVRGTVEVSANRQSWDSLIRNRAVTDLSVVRTQADSVGQVRTASGFLGILGPDTTVTLPREGLRLESGDLRVQGVGLVLTRLGTVESLEPDADFCLLDRGQAGLVCEVYEGFARITRPNALPEDVDGGERAVWDESHLTEKPADLAGVPIDLRPRLED